MAITLRNELYRTYFCSVYSYTNKHLFKFGIFKAILFQKHTLTKQTAVKYSLQ